MIKCFVKHDTCNTNKRPSSVVSYILMNRKEHSICYLLMVLGNYSRYSIDKQASQADFFYNAKSTKTNLKALLDHFLLVITHWQT